MADEQKHEHFVSLGGTYSVKKNANGNVILKSGQAKLVLKPAIVEALVDWFKAQGLAQ